MSRLHPRGRRDPRLLVHHPSFLPSLPFLVPLTTADQEPQFWIQLKGQTGQIRTAGCSLPTPVLTHRLWEQTPCIEGQTPSSGRSRSVHSLVLIVTFAGGFPRRIAKTICLWLNLKLNNTMLQTGQDIHPRHDSLFHLTACFAPCDTPPRPPDPVFPTCVQIFAPVIQR